MKHLSSPLNRPPSKYALLTFFQPDLQTIFGRKTMKKHWWHEMTRPLRGMKTKCRVGRFLKMCRRSIHQSTQVWLALVNLGPRSGLFRYGRRTIAYDAKLCVAVMLYDFLCYNIAKWTTLANGKQVCARRSHEDVHLSFLKLGQKAETAAGWRWTRDSEGLAIKVWKQHSHQHHYTHYTAGLETVGKMYGCRWTRKTALWWVAVKTRGCAGRTVMERRVSLTLGMEGKGGLLRKSCSYKAAQFALLIHCIGDIWHLMVTCCLKLLCLCHCLLAAALLDSAAASWNKHNQQNTSDMSATQVSAIDQHTYSPFSVLHWVYKLRENKHYIGSLLRHLTCCCCFSGEKTPFEPCVSR